MHESLWGRKNDNLEGKNLTHNLIVGDVKQSIYRWRSGDWRLLNGIESQFDRPESKVDIKNLQVNYRSERNIIKFNNIFSHWPLNTSTIKNAK